MPVYVPDEDCSMNASAAGIAERTFACAADVLAVFVKLRYAGTAIATRMPRMIMTTRSSMSVKPCSLARRFLILLIIRNLLLGGEDDGDPGIDTGERVARPPFE